MSDVFIEKEIKIHASFSKVWKVLVNKHYINQWIKEFSTGEFITEDWQKGSEITMIDGKGNVIHKGIITVFKPLELLKVEFEKTEYSEELALSADDKVTLLSARAGPVEETGFDEHSAAWDKGLLKIKELAEIQ